MLQYLLYFLLGGAVVASVAYLGNRGNAVLSAFVVSLPTLFLLSVFLMYRVRGIDGSLTYAKDVILMLPVFILYVALTTWLLPRVGMPKALVLGLPIYLIPLVVRTIVRHKISKKKDDA